MSRVRFRLPQVNGYPDCRQGNRICLKRTRHQTIIVWIFGTASLHTFVPPN